MHPIPSLLCRIDSVDPKPYLVLLKVINTINILQKHIANLNARKLGLAFEKVTISAYLQAMCCHLFQNQCQRDNRQHGVDSRQQVSKPGLWALRGIVGLLLLLRIAMWYYKERSSQSHWYI